MFLFRGILFNIYPPGKSRLDSRTPPWPFARLIFLFHLDDYHSVFEENQTLTTSDEVLYLANFLA